MNDIDQSEVEEIIEDMSDLQKVMVILFYSNSEEPIVGKTKFDKELKLQKEVFLISQNLSEIGKESSYDADYYGPYSETVAEEFKGLALDEVVQDNQTSIRLLPLGKEIAKELIKSYSKKILDMVSDFKKLINNMSQEEILTLIYTSFPDYTEESVVKEDVMRNRIKIAIQLYKKGKISLERTSEIAGLTLEKLMNEIG
jgi:uncharacterized protein YwgA